MQTFGHTEWLFARAATRPAINQSVGVLAGPKTTGRQIVLPALDAARLVPPWVVFSTILLAMAGICTTAVIRSRTELRASSVQRQSLDSQLQDLRETNQALQRDIERLTKDPSAIELAARERLGMVKANDIVVTMDSIKSITNVSNVSFVR